MGSARLFFLLSFLMLFGPTCLCSAQTSREDGRAVILKKNLVKGVNTLTQAMVNEPNTTYIIQDNFTLGNNLKFPSNCVLRFEGGRLTNGNISADNSLVIKADNKVFENVTFSGGCTENFFHSSWFTTPRGYMDKSYDHTVEIQNLFNSGVNNIIFDPGFYYITKTITITGSINIYTEYNNSIVERTAANASVPLIYSDKMVTMIDYVFKPGNRDKRSLYIGAIHVYCGKPFTKLTEESTKIPVVKIRTQGMLWGADIHLSVKADKCNVTEDGYTYSTPNYTGLELSTETGYMTMVRLHGQIMELYNAYAAFKQAGAWMTDIQILGMTQAVKGIDIDVDNNPDSNNISPLIVSSSHESEITRRIYGHAAYFYGHTIYDNSYVFDIGDILKSNQAKVTYKCLAEHLYNGANPDYNQNAFSSYRIYNTYEHDIPGSVVLINGIKDNTRKNFFSILSSNEADRSFFSYEYLINDTNVFDFKGGTIYNIDQLFPDELKHGDADPLHYGHFEVLPYLITPKNNTLKKVKFTVTIPAAYLNYRLIGSELLYKATNSSTTTLNIYIGNGGRFGLYKTFHYESINAEPGFFFRIPLASYVNDFQTKVLKIEFMVNYSNPGNKTYLPFFYLTNNGTFIDKHSLNVNYRLPNILKGSRVGFNYFDPVLNKQIWWNGSKWVDANGTPL